MSKEYQFTYDWFTKHLPIWDPLMDKFRPKKILEIGSFEGRATTYMIERASFWHDEIELHCVDTWCGSDEPWVRENNPDYSAVEARWHHNTDLALSLLPSDKKVNLIKHKGPSIDHLSKLIVDGHLRTFDWIYVDGSHLASDVLFDCVAAFNLAKVQGVIIFDDYNVADITPQTIHLFPKIAIDAFMTTMLNKMTNIPLINNNTGETFDVSKIYQLYTIKLAN